MGTSGYTRLHPSQYEVEHLLQDDLQLLEPGGGNFQRAPGAGGVLRKSYCLAQGQWFGAVGFGRSNR